MALLCPGSFEYLMCDMQKAAQRASVQAYYRIGDHTFIQGFSSEMRRHVSKVSIELRSCMHPIFPADKDWLSGFGCYQPKVPILLQLFRQSTTVSLCSPPPSFSLSLRLYLSHRRHGA
jgi:hypothetical protein